MKKFAFAFVMAFIATLIVTVPSASAAELTTVSGTVRNTHGGVLAGIGVRLSAADGSWSDETTSAADGTYSLRAPVGTSWLGVNLPTTTQDYYTTSVLTTESGKWGLWHETMSGFEVNVTANMNLDVSLPMTNYTINVEDQKGQLAAGALLVDTGLGHMTTDVFEVVPGASARVNRPYLPATGDYWTVDYKGTSPAIGGATFLMPSGSVQLPLPTLSTSQWSIWPWMTNEPTAFVPPACAGDPKAWLTKYSSNPMGTSDIWTCDLQEGLNQVANPESLNAFLERHFADRVLTVQYSDKPGSNQFARITKADLLDGEATVQLPYLSQMSATSASNGSGPIDVNVSVKDESGQPLAGVEVTLGEMQGARSGLRGKPAYSYPIVKTDARGHATLGVAPSKTTKFNVLSTNITAAPAVVKVGAAKYLAVSGFRAKSQTGKVSLTWKKVHGPVKNYVVQYRASAGAWATATNTLKKSRSSYVFASDDTGRFEFRVAALTAKALGTWSSIAKATVR